MDPSARLRFDVYGLLVVVAERVDGRWRLLEVGEGGKRRELRDLAPPADVSTPQAMRDWLEVCFHELGGPGMHVRLVE
ncbi:MAG: hypothetical protein WCJ30_08130 [Deltaproteobacteria bacterium]